MSVRVLTGDCRDVLRTLPDESVHCVVTSPPYFGLRDYGVAGQIGLEETPDAYVAEMVAAFREVRRVLRSDGCAWINLGDSYAGSWGAQGRRITESDDPSWHSSQIKNHPKRASNTGSIRQLGLKPKDLIGIPWMVAFALRADGWYLRSDIIWSKPNPMPESVRDRPTKAHEYLFLLTKSPRYYYDADAIKEDYAESTVRIHSSEGVRPRGNGGWKQEQIGNDEGCKNGIGRLANGGRNPRSVWTVATQPFSEAHFATFPPALIEPCIKAGTSEKGCCPACGAPWERQTEKPDFSRQPRRATSKDAHLRNGDRTSAGQAWQAWRNANPDKHLGWSPSCSCPEHKPQPCTVLDPFFGAGTTGLVADRLGRNCIGIELNHDYAKMATDRIQSDAGMFAAMEAAE